MFLRKYHTIVPVTDPTRPTTAAITTYFIAPVSGWSNIEMSLCPGGLLEKMPNTDEPCNVHCAHRPARAGFMHPPIDTAPRGRARRRAGIPCRT